MNEPQAAVKFLVATLRADPTVTSLVADRVFEGTAPNGSAYPFISVQFASGLDRRGSGSHARLMSRLLFQVRATVEGEDFVPADAVANALDAVLEDAQGAVTVGGTDYSVTVLGREAPVRFEQQAKDKAQSEYRHSGGLYRLHITEA